MILKFEATEITVVNNTVAVDGIDIDDLYEKVKAIKEDLAAEEKNDKVKIEKKDDAGIHRVTEG